MKAAASLLIISDIHYASAVELERADPEGVVVPRRWLRPLARTFRRLWLGELTRNNWMFNEFVRSAEDADIVVANGDFSCDTAFVGVSDDAAMMSAKECLAQLRKVFATSFQATIGDHELGRGSLFGGPGGPRLSSWFRCINDLKLQPFWQTAAGPYVLIGVTSSLLALDLLHTQLLPQERNIWHQLREEHLDHICRAFRELPANCRVLLFCHDPAALESLGQEEAVRNRFSQIAQTVVGHLHSRLVIGGIRTLAHLRNSVWRDFKVRVCPALACRSWPFTGLYYRVLLEGCKQPLRFELKRL